MHRFGSWPDEVSDAKALGRSAGSMPTSLVMHGPRAKSLVKSRLTAALCSPEPPQSHRNDACRTKTSRR